MTLGITLAWFWIRHQSGIPAFLALSPQRLEVLFLCALGVNAIKMFRLYFILYGNGSILSFLDHARQYCKVLPVSVVLPFKAGDLFRVYCYGYHLGSYGAGLVYIMLDRFIDTCALVTMVLLVGGISGGGWILWLLLGFVGAVLFCFAAFPSLCRYWRQLFLTRPASRRGLAALRALEVLDEMYQKISGVLRGKGLLLYLLSLVAWLGEMGGVLLLTGGAAGQVSAYLEAALTGGDYLILKQFVLANVLLLLGLYGILYLVSRRRKL